MNIPILLYHSVSHAPSEWIAPFTVTPETFERHIRLISQAGLQPLTVSQLRSAVDRRQALERPVVITFDDGFADTLDAAAPVLARYSMPATVYVTSGFVGGRSPGSDRMLGWTEVQQLAALGHEIGAHSVTHPELDTLEAAPLWHEVTRCRADLEQHLGQPVDSFAYPHGYSSPVVRRTVAAAGYRSACSVKNALSPYDDPPYAIARLTVMSDTTDDELSGWLAGRGPVARPHDRHITWLWRQYRRAKSWSR
ncbi:polysaccharide deacetylase family protein [Kribbella sp. WER1]